MNAAVIPFQASKVCKTCKLEKPAAEFPRHYVNSYGLSAHCKTCMKVRAAKWQQNWRDAHPRYHRKANLKRMYGLTESDYLRMLAEQGGGCAACRRSPEPNELFCVDHDHASTIARKVMDPRDIRGILCNPCNRGLGFFRENATALRNAAVYLETHQRRKHRQ